MKKLKYIFILPIFFLIFFLSGCLQVSDEKIYLKGYEDSNSILELSIGTPEYGNYTVVHEKDGVVEDMALEQDMISSYDRMKFYQAGEYTIQITAFNCTCDVKIKVARKTFDSIRLLDSTVTYDGQEHGLSFSSLIPAGTKVTYDIGNSFKEVGSYEITATLINDAYTTHKTTGVLTINKAIYDMSEVSYTDLTVTYDGKYKGLEITGDLPTGLNAIYSIEGYTSGRVVNAGEYTCTVTFMNSNNNFEDVEPMTATLTIEKGKYDMSNILFPDAEYSYDGNPKKVKIIGDLPEGVTVTYSAINSQNGVEVDPTKLIDKGHYYLYAEFTGDTQNYEIIEPMLAEVIIK